MRATKFGITLFTLCFSVAPCYAQTTMGGAVTMSGAVTMGGYTQSWSQGMRQITLALGKVDKDEFGKERFTTGGAGVLIRDTSNRFFIATALHVFDNPERHWAPESLQVRGWRDEKKSRYLDFGSLLTLRVNGQPLFFASKKFDLAIAPITADIASRLLTDTRQLLAAEPSSFGNNEETYDGADVFILGFPGLIGEEYQQRALMRTGIIAWTDATSPVDSEFLIDSRIFSKEVKKEQRCFLQVSETPDPKHRSHVQP